MTKVNLQGHHVIPRAVWDKREKELNELFKEMNIPLSRDSNANMIALASDAGDASALRSATGSTSAELRDARVGTVQHNGSHMHYSVFVGDALDEILGSNASSATKIKQVQGLHSFLTDALMPADGSGSTTGGQRAFLAANSAEFAEYRANTGKYAGLSDSDALKAHYKDLHTNYQTTKAYTDGVGVRRRTVHSGRNSLTCG